MKACFLLLIALMFTSLPAQAADDAHAAIACTQEAKMCADGSSVARSGPDCAFAPCPGDENADGDTQASPDDEDGDEDCNGDDCNAPETDEQND